jgi:hypothetical protein
VLKTLDTFEFAAQPSLNEARVRELVRGEYIDGKENVLLVGNPGTGSHGTARGPDRGPGFRGRPLEASSFFRLVFSSERFLHLRQGVGCFLAY